MEPTRLNISVDLLFYGGNILNPLERGKSIYFILFYSPLHGELDVFIYYSSQNDIQINTDVSKKEDAKFNAIQCNFVYRRSS